MFWRERSAPGTGSGASAGLTLGDPPRARCRAPGRAPLRGSRGRAPVRLAVAGKRRGLAGLPSAADRRLLPARPALGDGGAAGGRREPRGGDGEPRGGEAPAPPPEAER